MALCFLAASVSLLPLSVPCSRAALLPRSTPPLAIHTHSRRAALGVALGAAVAAPLAAVAAQSPKDLSRLSAGLADIQYLLDNWVVETTDPTSGAMAPDRARLYLGLRTTNHPLFQVDKVLAAAADKVPDDEFETWIEATEGFQSHLNKVNELAYTSSFGEYNPGGGKEQIAKYLELAREEVVLARNSLTTIAELLELPAAAKRTKPL